ncbi:ATP-dependent DNA helicase PIF1-like [Rutidosis leptorrhynchoides]|uniref:ATP-dependent DNA helicase PIF1-like n=1 Tax=Rutidosis leptorrhynchoides TaxID=125765 RepID=UPI003A9A12F9
MHGPCGTQNPKSPCMNETTKTCTKLFPKRFQEHTSVDENGYPIYRRWDNGITVKKDKGELHNGYVVPYNLFLLKKYQSHIKVERCNQSGAIKYLFKYINKGPDRITAGIVMNKHNDNDEEGRKVDEIKHYYDCRYISACEAAWRIFGNEIHYRTHAFTNWMERNKWDENARNLTYTEFPQKYVWDLTNRVWSTRKRKPKLGRIHHVPPSAGEAYYLRILLNKVKGPTSFEDIRTVNGKFPTIYLDLKMYGHNVVLYLVRTYSTGDEKESAFKIDYIFQRLYVTGLTMQQKDIDNHTLYEIETLLRNQGSTLKKFSGMPYPSSDFVIDTTNKLIHDELRYDRVALKFEHDNLVNSLNADQKRVYDEIISVVDKSVGGVFFVYGYGGTGKTFLWKTLSTAIRSKGKIVLNVASSGIASLLLSGGRTAHSRFVIPINVNEDSVCSIDVTSQLADLMRQSFLIIWDEAPMIHKHCFEALDRSLRDIMRHMLPENEDKVFGGKVVVFGGDFRQILPVIPKGSRQDIVNASLNSSYLWSHIKVLKLTVNMRLQTGCNRDEMENIKEFAQWILDVGNGTVGGPNDGDAEIIIPDEFLIKQSDNPINSIVESTYPDLINNLYENTFFQERAILAPTHEHVDDINERLLQLIPGDEFTYLSCDSVDASDNSMPGDRGMQSPEFLNNLKFSVIPNHKLVLKVGVPIMLLRNIDQPNGLCNGTRLRVTKLEKSLITAKVITGTNIGFETLIPRMKLSPSDNTLPFKITRKQFSVSMCFAMAINKSQGQSLSQVDLYLPRPVFTHGQLYVAISRVKNKNGLKILICDKEMNVANTTTNVVYKEVLQSL